jgi:uncharacterized protein YigA (DUF484 family)
MGRSSETANPPAEHPIGEEQVVEYLRAHPDLLARRPELLAKMTPPSRFSGGPVVDLQHYMIGRLSDELESMRGCAEHLITTSRSNMSIQSRTHEAVLAILNAGDVEGLLRVVAEDVPALLGVDIAIIAFEMDGRPHPATMPVLKDGQVDDSLGSGDVMLRSASTSEPAIFGGAASLVRSFALARLEPVNRPRGLLALGSRNDRTFNSSQGTELLAFMAHVIEDCLSRWWQIG